MIVTILGCLACGCLFIEPRGTFAVGGPVNVIGMVAYLVTA